MGTNRVDLKYYIASTHLTLWVGSRNRGKKTYSETSFTTGYLIKQDKFRGHLTNSVMK